MRGPRTKGRAEGEFLAQAYDFSAKHIGTVMGMPATNKSFEVAALDFSRFKNGKIVESWDLIDLPALLGRLGLMPG